MIPQKLLLDKGGTFRKYKKNQSIFFEGNMPGFYYQIVNGSIKMVSVNLYKEYSIVGNLSVYPHCWLKSHTLQVLWLMKILC
jgi:CRP-like cAMP-binding protein